VEDGLAHHCRHLFVVHDAAVLAREFDQDLAARVADLADGGRLEADERLQVGHPRGIDVDAVDGGAEHDQRRQRRHRRSSDGAPRPEPTRARTGPLAGGARPRLQSRVGPADAIADSWRADLARPRLSRGRRRKIRRRRRHLLELRGGIEWYLEGHVVSWPVGRSNRRATATAPMQARKSLPSAVSGSDASVTAAGFGRAV